MLFPVYVHVGDKDHAHGVTIPDLPGCFSAADEWEDLPRMVQEAVESCKSCKSCPFIETILNGNGEVCS
jgi:predicted RNase H-like HicB family nuclease